MKSVFSIVIPTLNEEKYLPHLLNDLVNQTEKNFEVIVVDGRSNDKTKVKALEFEDRLPITFLQSRKRNVSYQRNMGAKVSRSPIIVFMDADNRLPKTFTLLLKEKINKNNPDIFTCWVDNDKRVKANNLAGYINFAMELLYFLNYPVALGALIGIKKGWFGKLGGFSQKVVYGEDRDIVNRAYKKGAKYSLFKKPRYVYSMRKMKGLGKLGYIQKTTLLNVKSLLNLKIDIEKEWPMGGIFLWRKKISKYDIKSKNVKRVILLLKSIVFVKSKK